MIGILISEFGTWRLDGATPGTLRWDTDKLALAKTLNLRPQQKSSWRDESDLAIQDGNTDSASWLNLTGTTMSPVDKEKLAADMLAYCKRDTEAIVALLDRVRAAAK
jgi:hypothetical protein